MRGHHATSLTSVRDNPTSPTSHVHNASSPTSECHSQNAIGIATKPPPQPSITNVTMPLPQRHINVTMPLPEGHCQNAIATTQHHQRYNAIATTPLPQRHITIVVTPLPMALLMTHHHKLLSRLSSFDFDITLPSIEKMKYDARATATCTKMVAAKSCWD